MLTSVVFVAVGLVAMTSALETAHPEKECMKVFHPHTMSCCLQPPKKSKLEGIAECFTKGSKPKPGSCDVDICIGKKYGFATDDGKFDKKALTEFLEKEFDPKGATFAAIKKECIEGDLSKYGRPTSCDLSKIRHCSNRQVLITCQDWNNESECAGVKDLVKKCISQD